MRVAGGDCCGVYFLIIFRRRWGWNIRSEMRVTGGGGEEGRGRGEGEGGRGVACDEGQLDAGEAPDGLPSKEEIEK